MYFQGKNLTQTQGSRILFRNINFSLQKGETLLVQGQNGSGKTSLLKILTGLVLPQKGQIFYAGQNITQTKENYNTMMSYLGHKNSLKMWLTAEENIRYHYSLANPAPLADSLLSKLIAQLNLDGHLQTPCCKLSQGQCRKVALIALLLKEKPLWILDEPFTALDKESVAYFKSHLLNHLERGGMIVSSSHISMDEFSPQIIDLSKQTKIC